MSRTVQRALEAACAVAAAQGIEPEGARVIHAGSNVLVRCGRAPVVARVMTGTAALHDDPREWLDHEVAVLGFLAPHRVAVPPSPLIAPGPHEYDGLWLTFWTWLEHDCGSGLPTDPEAIGRSLRELHDRLAAFPGTLGNLTEIETWLAGLIEVAVSDGVPRKRLEALHDEVFASSLPAQALHGDVSLSNLLRTPDGLIWNDFEDVCRGPVHWDVAGLVESARHRGADEAFIRRVLAAYGAGLDLAALAPFVAAHRLYDEIWRGYEALRAR